MYFDRLKQMEADEIKAYNATILDGRPRNKWYVNAIVAVCEIQFTDENQEIKEIDFSNYKTHYDSVQWVAENDPEALKYIMGVLVGEVTDIVKEKLLGYLTDLKHYQACAIVQKYLKSVPAPAERTKKRKLEDATEHIKKHLLSDMDMASGLLLQLKTETPEKLDDPNLVDPLSHLLNLNATDTKKKRLKKDMELMEWMRLNTPDELKELMSITICKEVKDQLLNLLAAIDLFGLCQFLQNVIQAHPSSFYYTIPPKKYKFEDKEEDDPFFDDDDDDDDDEWWR